MSPPRAVTGTWVISQSIKVALNISKGVVTAASSDNIQVTALLACEGFGATLPICAESCAKAHQLCSRAHESTILSFLKAQIGFQEGDSGWQLSQSDAGLRFLALAACLVTIDWWRAAELLRKLITSTAADKRLIPTSQQIKQLLNAVSYRLSCSGFADNIIGWKIWIEKSIDDGSLTIGAPSSDTLFKLISTLSDLERLGEAQSVHVETPIDGAAWIIAFIKWCIGEPLTVTSLKPMVVLIQSSSRVYLHLRQDTLETKISTQDIVGSISDLWTDRSTTTGDFNGMVQLPNLANRLMTYLGPKTWLQHRAGREAISFGCRPVLERFRHKDFQTDYKIPKLSISQGSIFPDEEVIAHTLADFLGETPAFTLKSLPDNTLVEDLPSIIAVRDQLATSCRCVSCLNNSDTPKVSCTFDRYIRTISKCTATVLLASLLVSNTPEGVFLHLPMASPDVFDAFTSAVYSCLRNSGELSCSIEAVIDEILKLINRKDDRLVATKDWIMSVHQGQTIYPQVLSSLTLQKTGLLSLICVPGLIMHKGEKYRTVEVSERVTRYYTGSRKDEGPGTSGDDDASDSEDANDEDPLLARNRNIKTAHDEYQDSRTVWQVTTRDERLFLSITAPSLPSFPIAERNPIRAIWAASESFFITCAHDRYAPLSKHNPWLVATHPVKPTVKRKSERMKCGVVLTNRNEPMRFFALCAGGACVVRDDACLECCIHACQILNLNTIVC